MVVLLELNDADNMVKEFFTWLIWGISGATIIIMTLGIWFKFIIFPFFNSIGV